MKTFTHILCLWLLIASIGFIFLIPIVLILYGAYESDGIRSTLCYIAAFLLAYGEGALATQLAEARNPLLKEPEK